MARITVEDCLEQIPNRFQLVLAATYRARMLSQGHAPKIESKNKPGVTALREIAAGKVGLDRRACAFAGDDVNDQGCVQRLPDADDPPTSLALHIGW